MKRIDIVRQLVADLLDDHQHFQRIETLLSAQRQAIISFTPSQLESHTEQLMEHYRHIHQHAQQRIRGLQQLSLSADQHGMRQLREGLAPAAQQHLLTIWRDLPTQYSAANMRIMLINNSSRCSTASLPSGCLKVTPPLGFIIPIA